jgi:hypothetical protein
LFFPQLCFQALSHLQRIVAYRVMARVASSGRKSLRALTVRPYEAREDHFNTMKRSSGETDSVSSADNGRNESSFVVGTCSVTNADWGA